MTARARTIRRLVFVCLAACSCAAQRAAPVATRPVLPVLPVLPVRPKGPPPFPVEKCPPAAVAARPGQVVVEPIGPEGMPGDAMLYTHVRGSDIGEPRMVCGVDTRIFIPARTAPMRGVFVKPWSRGGRPGGYIEEAFRPLGFATVGVTWRLEEAEWYVSKGPALGKAMALALRRFAAASRRPEVAHLPFVTAGASRAGVWARDIAFTYPDRAIAYANVCGWVAEPKSEAQRQVPALFVLGNETNPKEPWRMLRSLLADYLPGAAQGNPWTAALQWGTNEHGCENEGALVLTFLQAVARARLPEQPALAGPPRLRALPRDGFWWGDRSGWRFDTRPARKPGDPEEVLGVELARPELEAPMVTRSDEKPGDNAVWLPDRSVAFVWRAFMTRNPRARLELVTDKPVAPPANGKPVRPRRLTVRLGDSLTLRLVPSDANAPLPDSAVNIYDADFATGIVLDHGSWSTRWAARSPGIHSLYATWLDAEGRLHATRPELVVVREEPARSASADGDPAPAARTLSAGRWASSVARIMTPALGPARPLLAIPYL